MAIQKRYGEATKAEKGTILDEFCRTTGYNRKSAIRLLRKTQEAPSRPRGRPRTYGPSLIQALKTAWEASDFLCSKRLAPFLPELVPLLERSGTLALSPDIKQHLLALSPATIDRLLGPDRRLLPRRPYHPSNSSSAIKAQVPIRTFGEWKDVEPGEMQGDLVLHCGESTGGFYLATLVMVDVACGWTQCQAVWGKTKARVKGALDRTYRGLPFKLRHFHTDNGSEFLNDLVYPYLRDKGIRSTRGRPYKKNDQAHVEQRNWTAVRRTVGYDRYATRAAYEQMEKLYRLLVPYMNFLQPMRKLVSKERVGSRVKKVYDEARTPYRRLLESGAISEEKKQALERAYERINPVELRGQIEQALEGLWKLREQSTKGQGDSNRIPR